MYLCVSQEFKETINSVKQAETKVTLNKAVDQQLTVQPIRKRKIAKAKEGESTWYVQEVEAQTFSLEAATSSYVSEREWGIMLWS